MEKEIVISKMTPFQKKKKRKEESIWNEYNNLKVVPGQSRMELMKYLQKKYGYESVQSVYKIIGRLKKKHNQN